MMSPASDGPTLKVVFYYRIRESTCSALGNLGPQTSPAVRLLLRWSQEAATSPEMFARFKCIGSVRNYEQAGLPSVFKSFNGKPVLIRNAAKTKGGSGTLERGTCPDGTSFIKMRVNIRAWPYMAKQGLGYLLLGLERADVDVGFVLEGSSDQELPEVILGAAQLTKLRLPTEFHDGALHEAYLEYPRRP